MTSRFVLLAVAGGLAVVRLVSADDNVRAVQMKLRDGAFCSSKIDGAYRSQLAAALTGYQTSRAKIDNRDSTINTICITVVKNALKK